MLLKSGKTCDEGIKFFHELRWGGLKGVQDTIPHVTERDLANALPMAMLHYTDWTATAVRQIREMVADPGIAARVRGDAYWVIIASDPSSQRTISMLHTELQEMSQFFQDCCDELRAQKERFRRSGRTLVLDTNCLLHYQRFDHIPWAREYGASARVVIPHLVIDEIDTKSYSEGEKISRRARGVYRVLEDYLDQIDSSGSATLPDGSTLEILSDEPGHRRVANNDDEVVARAAFLQQALFPQNVTVITRDIGMRTRARARLLNAEKLNHKYLIAEDRLSNADLDAAVATIEPVPSHAS